MSNTLRIDFTGQLTVPGNNLDELGGELQHLFPATVPLVIGVENLNEKVSLRRSAIIAF